MGLTGVGPHRRHVRRSAHDAWLALAAVAALVACGGGRAAPTTAPQPAGTAAPVRVLVLTATAGFRHDSIPAARAAIAELAAATGAFVVTMTEDVSELSAARLSAVDVVMFGLTSGELPLSDATRAALLDFVARGGGFIGVHSATDTLYTWPEYGDLVGAYFTAHPWTQAGTVAVEDRTHPTTAALGASFGITEEFYTFRENPRPRVHVLLSLDAGSVGAAGDYPLAWTRTSGAGRVYYNALGHFPATWNDARFRAQIRAAIAWAAGR